MFNKFKNLFLSGVGTDRNRFKMEFNKILTLETKRLAIIDEYKDEMPKEVITTQKDILRNNLLMLAKTVDIKGGFKNTENDIKKGIYFNIQGTKPQVYILDGIISMYSCCEIEHLLLDEYSNYSLSDESFDIIKAFLNLKSKKIRKSIKQKLELLAEKKIQKETIKFSQLFKGNEDLVQEYIFSDLQGENDHWHDFISFNKRLNILKGLYPYIKDSEDFDIKEKKVIFIHAPVLKHSLNKFLKRINNKKYDFIISQ